ncbi:hypothetical protein GI584_14395 [Gracilibacillus salitolerans]|uniref:Uncharacterized protein n=1 Tax=Gracilibacillus salitolerans TaxID=2663022 RepID=A0A5Q2TM45_9BACI|nr:hypothetical protein [Gracilibacillus salitolerans]QGH35162.1 hypothetical protein GI584_14395 [Gracilibacillus salitolerans]
MTKNQPSISQRAREKLNKHKHKKGLVHCLEDYNRIYSEGLICVVTELHEEGVEVEEIAKELNRSPMEIIIALLHQSDNQKITKPFATRKRTV